MQLGAELQGEDVRARILHAEPLDDAAAKTQRGCASSCATQAAGVDRETAEGHPARLSSPRPAPKPAGPSAGPMATSR
jgi:DNA polymerase-3 subunit alpha